MHSKKTPITVSGQYYWEVIFSYDNRQNKQSEIRRQVELEVIKEINSRNFFSSNLKLSSGFTFKNETSASVKFDEVTVGSKTEYTFHIEAALALEKISETTTNIQNRSLVKENFVVKPGDSLVAYQLCYSSDGTFLRTATTKVQSLETPKPEGIGLKLAFTANQRLLGYRTFTDTLLQIRPRHDNIAEWNAIREIIIESKTNDEFEAFYKLVKQLSETNPGRDNKEEWSGIRVTCNQILADRGVDNTQKLFLKLLTRLATVFPGRDNREEWSKIREKSQELLNGINLSFD